MASAKKYLLGVDIGTTNVRCIVYGYDTVPVGHCELKLETNNPQPGHFDIDPENLFDLFVRVVKGAMESAKITANEVLSMGISVQRNSFTCWNKLTGKLYFPLSSWMDTRAAPMVESWNRGYIVRLINFNSRIAYFLTRSARFAVGSILSFKTTACPVRLYLQIESNPELKADMKSGNVQFGCIETYIVWRLSGSRIHVTEPSCASATQFYDIFVSNWSPLTTSMFGIPHGIFPRVVSTNSEFCETAADLFGAPISLRALSADQQASAFGECCFTRGDVKCTLGTAGFININTGETPHGSMQSIYPLAGWKLKEKDGVEGKTIFFAEGHVRAAGLLLEWLRNVGMLSDFASLDSILESVPIGANGVCFVGAPDSTFETREEHVAKHDRSKSQSSRSASVTSSDSEFDAGSCKVSSILTSGYSSDLDLLTRGIVGVRMATTRNDMVRGACESIVFGVFKILKIMTTETAATVSRVRLSGGVSRSRVMMQMLADLSGCVVERGRNADDASCFGAAALAGVATGFWNMEYLKAQRVVECECTPDAQRGAALRLAFNRWTSVSNSIA